MSNDTLERWTNAMPLFDHFFVVGPPEFQNTTKNEVLYSFPDRKAKNEYPADVLLFPVGKQKNLNVKNSESLTKHISSPNKIVDKLAYIKIDGDAVTYTFSLVFRVSPFSRPSFLSTDLQKECIKYSKISIIPSALCALVFVTKHPFPSLYFSILEKFLSAEAKVRSESKNMQILRDGILPNPNDDPMEYWPLSTHFEREKTLKTLLEIRIPNSGDTSFIGNEFIGFTEFSTPSGPFFRMPLLEYSTDAILEWIDFQSFNKLVNALLLEQYPVAVVGNNLTNITKAVVYLSQATTPFPWTCPISALVPPILHDLFNSPMALIAGVPLSDIDIIPDYYIIINLEKKTIMFPEEIPMFSWNNMLENIYKLYKGKNETKQYAYFHTELCNLIETQIAVPMCQSIITVIDENPRSSFDKERFVSEFHESDRDFMKHFLDAQHTSYLIEHLCSKKTQRAINGDVIGSNELEKDEKHKVVIWDEDSQSDLRSVVYLPYM